MNSVRRSLILGQLVARQLSQTAPRNAEVSAKITRLRAKQQKFGIEDGVPVHVKGGVGDKLLYGASTALVLVGLGFSLQVFWKLTFKEA